jgi:hypothetical protein
MDDAWGKMQHKAVERAKDEAVEVAKQKEINRVDKEKLEAWSQYLSEGMTLPKAESIIGRQIVAFGAAGLCSLADDIYKETQKM